MNECFRKINADLECVRKWAVLNEISINAGKFQDIVLGIEQNAVVPPPLVNGIDIPFSTQSRRARGLCPS